MIFLIIVSELPDRFRRDLNTNGTSHTTDWMLNKEGFDFTILICCFFIREPLFLIGRSGPFMFTFVTVQWRTVFNRYYFILHVLTDFLDGGGSGGGGGVIKRY